MTKHIIVPPQPELFDQKESLRTLRCTRQTFWRYRKAGRIRTVIVGKYGKKWYDPDEIRAVGAERNQRSTSP